MSALHDEGGVRCELISIPAGIILITNPALMVNAHDREQNRRCGKCCPEMSGKK